ncbi:hypothetical protein [Amycolatopsis palatopharyngis]|uniref:hypothetical protein n=1 Tax=Amycolatopsis palatopharyngis TaxID=187982 RepID=UPI000E21C98E|nr:hypothetical protein [Amycolatopsis palatopharyngis]
MSNEKYPSLGFDPARGEVVAVRDLAEQLSGTGTFAGEAYDVLKSVQDNRDIWTGEAAQAFAGNLDELPGFLDGARTSMHDAGKALATWGDRLEAHQARARELEELTRQAIADAKAADAKAAEANAANVPIAYDTSDPASARAAQQQAQATADAAKLATEAAGTAWGRVDDLRRQAEELRNTWEDDARICAEALNDAAENAPDSGLFDAIGDGIRNAGEWLAENLGDIAGIVAAVAGALAFIPILTPIMAPIALGAGAIALAAHGTEMIVEEKWDDMSAWVELGGDVAGLIPGVGALGKGFGAASDVVAGTDKLVDVTRVGMSGTASTAGEAAFAGGKAFAHDMSQPSAAAKWLVERTTGVSMAEGTAEAAELVNRATNTARTIEGGTNVALQVPSAVSFADQSSEASSAKDAAGAGSAVLAGITAMPRIS